jgi:hypothetical protein
MAIKNGDGWKQGEGLKCRQEGRRDDKKGNGWKAENSKREAAGKQERIQIESKEVTGKRQNWQRKARKEADTNQDRYTVRQERYGIR